MNSSTECIHSSYDSTVLSKQQADSGTDCKSDLQINTVYLLYYSVDFIINCLFYLDKSSNDEMIKDDRFMILG